MKKTKKIGLFIFTMVLAVLMSVPTNAEILSSEKVMATIDEELQIILKDVSIDKRTPVDIWLYETSTVEEREQKIFSKIGLNQALITADTKASLSSERIDEYIMTERALYAEERNRQYESIRFEYSNVQGLQEKRQADTRLFYSQYAPMISAELTSAEIKTLACDKRVAAIYYSPDVVIKDEADVSFPSIGADYVRDTLHYTGTNVKIGMIESNVPDINEPYLNPNKIHCEDNLGEIVGSHHHANMTAAIMVGNGNTYKGIVPDAELYATCFDPDSTTDWRQRVEWLLSQGVHIINMSAGIPISKDGQYTVQDRWVDHIAHDHYVHFVKSSGNNTQKITTPGLAYNIITVGAIDDKNTLSQEDDELGTFSNYVECVSKVYEGTPIEYEMYPTNKPDLVAPGVNITTVAGTDSGTSFAAPHVAGVVAQVCGFIPSLKVMQPVVKAVLTASVSHSEYAYNTGFMGEGYNKFGAGVVNAKAAFETLYAYRMMGGSFPAKCDADEVKTFTFTASVDQRVRVSLTWQKYAYLAENIPHVICNPSEFGVDDLDLCIFDPDGVLVGDWRADDHNMEIADFVAAKSGTYTIKIQIRESPKSDISIGIAWWLQPVNNLSNSN
ncbi:MAG: S8 family peptidase [Clostridia bacterium]|nr:S8 family peptidase [Clostridia bacterium]